MPNLGKRVQAERIERGWSQEKLAAEVTRQGFKIGQSGIGNIESGRSKSPKCIAALAAALNVSFTWLTEGKGEKMTPAMRSIVHNSVMSGTAQLLRSDGVESVILMWHSSPATGPGMVGAFMLNQRRGRLIDRPADLINRDKAFCFLLVGRENEPAYNSGDRLDVDPDKTVEEGRDYLFLREPRPADNVPSMVGRLVRITERAWVICQYGVKGDRDLPRDVWPVAWKIVGRHHRE